jgi:hypothetical protein
MINYYFVSLVNVEKDYVIYVDTDSCFFSVIPILEITNPDIDYKDVEEMSKAILDITKKIQSFVNSAMNNFKTKIN